METLRFQVELDAAKGEVEVQGDGTIVQTIGDQRVVLTQEGKWTISDVPEEGTVTPQFVSGCTGWFSTPQRVSGYLQSGAIQTCTEGAYPHWIDFQLRSTCEGWWCIGYNPETDRIRSNSGLGYSRVASVTYTEDCQSSNNRKYSQIVWPMARGVQFGPFVDRDEPVVNCDLNG